ncbi:MAG: tRNA (adenosine(37)-N6)-threonylcarbamoyltransferase complex dimerization subunit type 1 TsaB [Chthoniobacterales bacterium]
MNILALELSSGWGSIAWMENKKEIFAAEFANDRKHSGLFFENLERALAHGRPPERIVVGLGPGSYAGTRIAIATATGLQAATGAELIGLPSLCAMPTEDADYAVLGDARRQSFFFARVLRRRCVEGPLLFTADELSERLENVRVPIFSAEPLPAFPSVLLNHPVARILGTITAEEWPASTNVPLEPMYLREAHITQPKAAIAR